MMKPDSSNCISAVWGFTAACARYLVSRGILDLLQGDDRYPLIIAVQVTHHPAAQKVRGRLRRHVLVIIKVHLLQPQPEWQKAKQWVRRLPLGREEQHHIILVGSM